MSYILIITQAEDNVQQNCRGMNQHLSQIWRIIKIMCYNCQTHVWLWINFI